jgi:hypothetical protein
MHVYFAIGATWLITLGGGGGQIDHGYGELYFTKASNLKEGQIGPIKRKFLIFFLLSIFYLPLFNSVTKKRLFLLEKHVYFIFKL